MRLRFGGLREITFLKIILRCGHSVCKTHVKSAKVFFKWIFSSILALGYGYLEVYFLNCNGDDRKHGYFVPCEPSKKKFVALTVEAGNDYLIVS